MAPHKADTNIIAVELYKSGLAKLLGAIVRESITNIRMISGDGVEVLTRMFEPGTVDWGLWHGCEKSGRNARVGLEYGFVRLH